MSESSGDKTHAQQLQSSLEKLAVADLPADTQRIVSEIDQFAVALIAEMEKTQEAAFQAKQDKAKFVSVVTHELRIPLTSIKGYTDILRQGVVGPVNDQQTNFLNVIRSNVDRMSALISDLADMSHLQSGRLNLQPKPCDISEQIDELVSFWRPRFTEKNQALLTEAAADLPTLLLDPVRFAQVAGCLISNANRYTQNDGKISLRIIRSGEILRVEVQDNGIGISEGDQKHLFEPFFRSEDPAVRDVPGWGLALHVAKLLVTLMGGQIGVQSQLGQGSTFWFTLPMVSV